MNLGGAFLGLDSPGWLALGLGSLVTLIVALLTYHRQKTPKTLDYGSYELQPLGADDDVYPGLKLAASWSPLEEDEPEMLIKAQVAHYRIKNTGKRAIKATDFQRPITVTAPKGRLIDCAVTEISHPGVCELGSIYVSCDGPRPDNELSFTPALMNPGDWVEISVLTDGLDGEVDISSWIVEETRSMRERDRIVLPPFSEIVRHFAVEISPSERKITLYHFILATIIAVTVLVLALVFSRT